MVSGVSGVQVYGAQKYAVRVQVDPEQLAAHGIGIDDVQRAIEQANTNLPTGKLDGANQAFTVMSNGQLTERGRLPPADRGLSQRRSDAPGTGRQRDRRRGEQQGRQLVQRRARHHSGDPEAARHQHRGSGGRHSRAAAANCARSIPPAVKLEIAFDSSGQIKRSIDDVKFTLVLTVCLVVMVIFLFLRNLSATLIPGVAVPLSILGTFARDVPARLQPEQSLADGADAVGGLRGGRRHRDAGEHRAPHGDGRNAHGRRACWRRKRSASPFVSMTISLVAVFIPVLFMGGIVGRLLHEFSVTIALAILISGLISLTLTPMLGSRFLQHGSRRAARLALSRARSAASTGWRAPTTARCWSRCASAS